MFSDDIITTGISLNAEDSCTISIECYMSIREDSSKVFVRLIK